VQSGSVRPSSSAQQVSHTGPRVGCSSGVEHAAHRGARTTAASASMA
jgi:hypothetical protein